MPARPARNAFPGALARLALVFTVAWTLVSGLAVATQQADRVAVGDQAVEFTLESIDGESFALADLRGEKAALLIFFRGTW